MEVDETVDRRRWWNEWRSQHFVVWRTHYWANPPPKVTVVGSPKQVVWMAGASAECLAN